MTISLIPTFLVAALGVFAADSHDKSVESLRKVNHFVFGGVGFAGAILEGEKEYGEIMARASAAVDFEKAFQTGNLQAKSYALVALYKLNHDKFMQLSAPLRKDETKVSMMTGCVVSQLPISAVIAQIESGGYSPKK